MPKTIFLVDDDTVLLATSAMMLEDCGCEVTTAQSGPSALEALERNPKITHLVTDVQVPRMDGYELARQAIALRPSLSVFNNVGSRSPSAGLRVSSKAVIDVTTTGRLGIECYGHAKYPALIACRKTFRRRGRTPNLLVDPAQSLAGVRLSF
jgi:two-component system cell cycle response regulator CpdR